MSTATASKRAGCTIIARNYLAQARVLASSYLKHEPDGRFFVLVVDGLPNGTILEPGVTTLGPDDLQLPDLLEWAFKYDVTELSTAVKPVLLSIILENYGVEQIVYLDPDIEIFRPLDEMWHLLDEAPIVLIPHLLDPIPLDGKRPSEQDILISGAYNLGFIGLRSSPDAHRLLEWWTERLRDRCFVDVAHGLFVDQKWIDLVPSLFPCAAVLYDATYDVAYWNLHSRRLEDSDEGVLVSGRPLAFFHYSGFDPTCRRVLSKHQDRIEVHEGTPLAQLLDRYSERVHKVGYALVHAWPYTYANFDNGLAISRVHRRLYATTSAEQRAAFGDPFQTAHPRAFFRWACEPPSSSEGLSPFLEQLLVEAPDAQSAFPDARGRQQKAFLTWAQTWGADAFGFDARLADPAAWPVVSSTPLTGASRNGVDPAHGVNVIGYLRNETGLGAAARGFVSALRAAGVAVGLRDLAELSPNRSQDATLGVIDGETPYRINLLVVNADQHFVVKSHLGAEQFADHYNIGYWSWELPTFPSEWLDRFQDYDEIWTPSSFIADALAPVSPVPVIRMPPVLAAAGAGSREDGRQRLQVDDDTFVFLFIFDFASYFQRKNPLAAIEAFKQAFSPDEHVRLVIKCVNEQLDRDAFDSMRQAGGQYPVSIFNGYWSTDEVRDLIAGCDAYVSLHRSEGLGHTIADAMAVGKPVIATGWSGNMDFMNVTNSFPVAFELVPLATNVGPYPAGSTWAEPSVDDAARLMRLVVDEPQTRDARAEAARRDIGQQYSETRRAQTIQVRLKTATERLKRRGDAHPAPTRGPATGRLTPPTVPPMDLGDSSHGGLGVLGKRAMNSLLRYHTHYQGELNLAFAAFMRQLQADHDALQTHLEVTQNNLVNLKREVERIDSYFSARPYMAIDAFGTSGDLSQPMGFGVDGRHIHPLHDFADLFRGSEAFISDRQRGYLRFLNPRQRVVDLGSGRGEFLELLRQHGFEDAIGVELDPVLVERSRQRGLQVELADALEFLSQAEEASVDVIFSAQFIEHIPSDRLSKFVDLARSRLRDGGLFIAETVNPESYLAQKTFFVDLSHQRLIFPQVLLHLCQTVGYHSARIFYPTAGGFTQNDYRNAGEYAVIAVK